MKKYIYKPVIFFMVIWISGCNKYNSSQNDEILKDEVLIEKEEEISKVVMEDFSGMHTYEVLSKIDENMPEYRFLVIGDFVDGYNGYVSNLRVYDENNNLFFKASDLDFGEDKEYGAIKGEFMDTMGLEIVDVNFDGHKDIVTLDIIGGAHGNPWYNCWVWDDNNKTFQYVETFKEICNPSVVYERESIFSTGGSGASYWGGYIYKFVDGEFIVTNRLDTYYEGIEETALLDGALRLVRKTEYDNLEVEDEYSYYSQNDFWKIGSSLWRQVGGNSISYEITQSNNQKEGKFSESYVGRIGMYPIHMELTFDKDKVSGSYYYDKYKEDIPLEGQFQGRGIRFYNVDNLEYFSGVVEGDVIKGYWESGINDYEFYITKDLEALKDNRDITSNFKVDCRDKDMGSDVLTWVQPSGYFGTMIEISNIKGKDVTISAESNGVVYAKYVSKANETVKGNYSFILENVPVGLNTLHFEDENGGLYETIGYINYLILFKGGINNFDGEEYLKAKYIYDNPEAKDYEVIKEESSIQTDEGERLVSIITSDEWFYYENLGGRIDRSTASGYYLYICDSNGNYLQDFAINDYIEEVYYVDMNFDGKLDIVTEQLGTMNQPKEIYLWDSGTNKFIKAKYDGFNMLSYYEIKDGYIKNFLKGGAKPEDNEMLRLEWIGDTLYNVKNK